MINVVWRGAVAQQMQRQSLRTAYAWVTLHPAMGKPPQPCLCRLLLQLVHLLGDAIDMNDTLTITKTKEPAHCCCWSKDGKYVLAAGDCGIVKLVEITEKKRAVRCTYEGLSKVQHRRSSGLVCTLSNLQSPLCVQGDPGLHHSSLRTCLPAFLHACLLACLPGLCTCAGSSKLQSGELVCAWPGSRPREQVLGDSISRRHGAGVGAAGGRNAEH